MTSNCIAASALLLLLGGCTWVELNTGAETVDVRRESAVRGCERLGFTTTSVRERVAGVERSPGKVEAELATLARNSALELGGDTVAPLGPIEDGEQRFGIYRCLR